MLLIKLVCNNRNIFSIGSDDASGLSSIIHSDTIFSTICNNFRLLYGKQALESFLSKIIHSADTTLPVFQISSAFHYLDVFYQDKLKNTLKFIPKPMLRLPFSEKSQKIVDLNLKLLKRIEYISFGVLKKIQSGIDLDFTRYHIFSDKYLLDSSDLDILGISEALEDQEYNILDSIQGKWAVYDTYTEEKVRINRIDNSSEPFTIQKLKLVSSEYFVKDKRKRYKTKPGYYFFLNDDGLTEEEINKVITSIKYIKDEGIGGKRSIGCGLCDDIKVVENLPEIFNEEIAGPYENLSLLYPVNSDLPRIKYYSLIERSGYVTSPNNSGSRIMDHRFMREGGIFSEKIKGKIIQVASDELKTSLHPVYKNGIGFFVHLGNEVESNE
ncbi:MAG: type III-A CRISPR-associated RAMP protein Csm4 [Candidatus Lokiarchaeota archaeon]|nr:type III-A CRISPR-associated RAMP protein Csm4 [Candidatus Lokiarchaeota archaeon]